MKALCAYVILFCRGMLEKNKTVHVQYKLQGFFDFFVFWYRFATKEGPLHCSQFLPQTQVCVHSNKYSKIYF